MPTTRTERLTVPARDLHRADRILDLVAGRTVTVFDLEVGDETVDVWPAQADLDAGAARRYAAPVDQLVTVERAVEAPARTVASTLPARQLALDLTTGAFGSARIGRTADEDGAQLDLFEAATEECAVSDADRALFDRILDVERQTQITKAVAGFIVGDGVAATRRAQAQLFAMIDALTPAQAAAFGAYRQAAR